MDNAIPEEKLAVIKEAIFRGEKISAIKLYREATGLGLAEAKEAVERLEAGLRSSSPFDFRKEQSRGCLGIVLILFVLAGGIVYFALR